MDSEETIELFSSNRKKWSHYIPARYILLFWGFLGFCNVYALRVNLSVALVSMVNNTAYLKNETQSVECTTDLKNDTDKEQQKDGEFLWDSTIQGIILGSFFYGYIITQIPGGRLAEMFGGKWLFGIGVLGTAILTLLTPVASRFHVAALIVVRILEGLGEGVTFPAMHALLARWIPKTERSSASAFVYSGSSIGTVIALPLSGLMCDSTFLGGWPSVFYVFGGLTCIWFLFWIIFIHDTPEIHPRISMEELVYIQTNQGDEKAHMKPIIPWKKIFTSVPVWALLITHFGQNWGFYMLLTELPTYLSTILHFNIKENSAISSLPYLTQAIFNWVFGYIADHIRKTGRISTTTIRKVCNSIGFFGPAICLIGVASSGCNHTLNVVLFILAMGFNGLIYSGFIVTHIDMSPDFAGTLMGITNAAGTIPGILAPIIVGVMTENEKTLKMWSYIFYMAAAVYTICNIIFILFGSAQLQPWGIAKEYEQISGITSSTKETSINVQKEEKQL